MPALEKRVTDLEGKSRKEKTLKLVFCEVGQTAAQARRAAGVAKDYPGKVVCVQFVEAHANKGDGHGNT